MVAVTWLGLWVLVLFIAALMYLLMLAVGKALGWFGEQVKGPEIGEWEVYERSDEGVRQTEDHDGVIDRRS